MTTDGEYRALAERLGESADGWDECGPSYADNSALERAASSAILALLDERERQAHAIDVFRQNLATMNAAKNEQMTRANLAESRLGKAVDLLQRTINGPADTHDEEWALFDETIAFLSDLEKSE